MDKFFHRVGAAFKKLFGSTTWEKTTSATITYVAPLLETLVALTAGGPAETLVAGIVAKVQKSLATVSAVVEDATATPPANELAAVEQALGSIQTNLPTLLEAAEIKNSTHATEITATTNTIIGEVDAILQNIPSATAPATATA